AIRSISIAKGYDPRDYVLVAFGGAAPQHAVAVARELGIGRVLNHPDAGVLSALGIGLADVVRHRASGIYQPLTAEPRQRRPGLTRSDDLEIVFSRLAAEATDEVLAEGVPRDRILVSRSLDLRYHKTDSPLHIFEPDDGDWRTAFEREHERQYGYTFSNRSLEVVAARVAVHGRADSKAALPDALTVSRAGAHPHKPSEFVTAHFAGREHQTALVERTRLVIGEVVRGPAIIVEQLSTTVVEPDWQGEVLPGGELLLTPLSKSAESSDARRRAAIASSRERVCDEATEQADPIQLEIFNNHFAAIAEQMGITLRNTATSVNVKERLDYSCAIFDASADLVVNAPHIPVHLGAMSETVRRIIADNPEMRPGDTFITNDPYRGGSHLPDVTVVTPVHDATTGQLVFFTASRAHHAEIGGITPGSMPPQSRSLAEEGVLIRNFRLFAAGDPRWQELRTLLSSGPYPSRSVEDNLSDIAAQVAANRQGVRDLLRLVDQHSLAVVMAYMHHIQVAAEQKMRAALTRLGVGEYSFSDALDDGSPIQVRITISPPPVENSGLSRVPQATIDFTGTGNVLPGNLNANRAIVTAAVMYVLRCLIDEDIPLNQGVLSPIEIVLPECLLNPPDCGDARQCAAVVGGNVETSQRVVDVLLGALGLAAASQGTMNNLLFGDDTFGYYETICGGAGATADGDGADAVHTHMTNTRLTDPEVLESRFPVRLLEFRIRHGSGGAGRHRGGNGVVRRIEFLRPLRVSLLTQRRGPFAPYGLQNGQPGSLGRNYLSSPNSRAENPHELPNQITIEVAAGNILTVETPGGGGFEMPSVLNRQQVMRGDTDG
ncbi:MAG: hydantoinase B/oxoprolinase family protein, partial [Planctomycetales bacterium]|nr:hydantoinase B/oxoprolinase family protein [Planctomycetales bacterium]